MSESSFISTAVAASLAVALFLSGCATTAAETPAVSRPKLDPKSDANPFASTYKPLPGTPTTYVGIFAAESAETAAIVG